MAAYVSGYYIPENSIQNSITNSDLLTTRSERELFLHIFSFLLKHRYIGYFAHYVSMLTTESCGHGRTPQVGRVSVWMSSCLLRPSHTLSPADGYRSILEWVVNENNERLSLYCLIQQLLHTY